MGDMDRWNQLGKVLGMDPWSEAYLRELDGPVVPVG